MSITIEDVRTTLKSLLNNNVKIHALDFSDDELTEQLRKSFKFASKTERTRKECYILFGKCLGAVYMRMTNKTRFSKEWGDNLPQAFTLIYRGGYHSITLDCEKGSLSRRIECWLNELRTKKRECGICQEESIELLFVICWKCGNKVCSKCAIESDSKCPFCRGDLRLVYPSLSCFQT